MSKKMALTIMKLSNLLVSELRDCSDIDFVDRILEAVMNCEIIYEDEMYDIFLRCDDNE